MVNAHSHAFQRVIRGRTEHRSAASSRDSFWTWREMMYAAAARLTPEDIYDASRMAFAEMALAGVTAVGEFHYLHRAPDGAEYDDPNLLAKQVVRAARDVGLRVALLRVSYARSGFQTPPNERQRRFIEARPRRLRPPHRSPDARPPSGTPTRTARPSAARGPASPRTASAPSGPKYLRAASAFADAHGLPLHMHVAEQPAEVAACVAETGRTPVALLADEGVLSARFTGVHAVHITADEARALARAGAMVCACPTTERNLGDGVVPADLLFAAGVAVSLGTDSHTQIDLLEDARELEYHLRLQRVERNVLAPEAERGGGGRTRRQDARREHPSARGAAVRVRDDERRAQHRRHERRARTRTRPPTSSPSIWTTPRLPARATKTCCPPSSSRSPAPPSAKWRSAVASSSKKAATARRKRSSRASPRCKEDSGGDGRRRARAGGRRARTKTSELRIAPGQQNLGSQPCPVESLSSPRRKPRWTNSLPGCRSRSPSSCCRCSAASRRLVAVALFPLRIEPIKTRGPSS